MKLWLLCGLILVIIQDVISISPTLFTNDMDTLSISHIVYDPDSEGISMEFKDIDQSDRSLYFTVNKIFPVYFEHGSVFCDLFNIDAESSNDVYFFRKKSDEDFESSDFKCNLPVVYSTIYSDIVNMVFKLYTENGDVMVQNIVKFQKNLVVNGDEFSVVSDYSSKTADLSFILNFNELGSGYHGDESGNIVTSSKVTISNEVKMTKINTCTVIDKNDKSLEVNATLTSTKFEIVLPSLLVSVQDNTQINVKCVLQINPKVVNPSRSNNYEVFVPMDSLTSHTFEFPPIQGNPDIETKSSPVALISFPLALDAPAATLTDLVKSAEELLSIVLKNLTTDKLDIFLLDISVADGKVLSSFPAPVKKENSYLMNVAQPSLHAFRMLSNTHSTVTTSFSFNSALKPEDVSNALEDYINHNSDNQYNNWSTSVIIDEIIQNCLKSGLGCGDLCAPCIEKGECKVDYDCLSGVCSFGRCTEFNIPEKSKNTAFNYGVGVGVGLGAVCLSLVL